MSPFTGGSTWAPGASWTTLGSDNELMPSRTVPIFSNSCDISHMTHWLMPWKRSTSATDTAMAPAVIWPCVHNQMPTPQTEISRARFSP